MLKHYAINFLKAYVNGSVCPLPRSLQKENSGFRAYTIEAFSKEPQNPEFFPIQSITASSFSLSRPSSFTIMTITFSLQKESVKQRLTTILLSARKQTANGIPYTGKQCSICFICNPSEPVGLPLGILF